ncbi:nadh dehydrogenase 1 beta subcomplex 7 [Plasmopara halstedii]|uniref:NADH dehydrogenase [ubiquinone] 1 beta subcomplex subunit 7 n=1 Tax=Plasmopara halstedii TaxID=4781 RepID=A0A0P1A6C0_PLAHL|nr:nadh dehydrogenase 1 beta subcomplex 7 [Plasmopara halstedii]CEG36127.1 nadh dehydrogenase 1 beta subcomplex 7 [Plasmopara halstedii]|eukprot:XP_024572496.1 nadh dehydrogenase 1 beta subcomplex 7 [Plasmopara halstedii]
MSGDHNEAKNNAHYLEYFMYVNAYTVGPRMPTRQEMVDAKLPLNYRDTCAGLLIPLNKCRRSTLFLPWKCQDLRHAYEKCQYEEWKIRVELLKNQE